MTSQLTSATLLNLPFPTFSALRTASSHCALVIRRGNPGLHPVPLINRDMYGAIYGVEGRRIVYVLLI